MDRFAAGGLVLRVRLRQPLLQLRVVGLPHLTPDGDAGEVHRPGPESHRVPPAVLPHPPHPPGRFLLLRRADVEQQPVAGPDEVGDRLDRVDLHFALEEAGHLPHANAAALGEAAADEQLVVHAVEEAVRQAAAERLGEVEFGPAGG